MNSWDDFIAAFELRLRAARRSDATITTYLQYVRRIAKLAPDPGGITPTMLAGFVAGDGIKPKSSIHRRAVCKVIFQWAFEEGIIPSDPSRRLLRPNTPRAVPRPATDADMLRIVCTDEAAMLMIALASRCGLRRGEIAVVRRDNVFQDGLGWCLRVVGKGDKERIVPVPDDLGPLIAGTGWLFPSRGSHITPGTVWRHMRSALPPNVVPHQLRHRFATRAYNLGGKDIRAVQELLGHSSVVTTQIYTAVEDQAKRRAALAA